MTPKVGALVTRVCESKISGRQISRKRYIITKITKAGYVYAKFENSQRPPQTSSIPHSTVNAMNGTPTSILKLSNLAGGTDMTDIPRDDLVKRLRMAGCSFCVKAADRIEVLEAALAQQSEREAALVEASQECSCHSSREGRSWMVVDKSCFDDLERALAAYDPSAVTSEAGAPHDGRAQPKEYLDEANYPDKDYLAAWRGE